MIALHKYGQDDILDRLSEEMSHLYVKEAERVKIWTDTYVVRQGTKLKVTIGKYEERVEPDIFVGTDNIYFRYVIENRECSGYERLMIDSTGNARHVTEKHRNIVRNHKTLLIALHY